MFLLKIEKPENFDLVSYFHPKLWWEKWKNERVASVEKIMIVAHNVLSFIPLKKS
jgi:hypothetical protein